MGKTVHGRLSKRKLYMKVEICLSGVLFFFVKCCTYTQKWLSLSDSNVHLYMPT